MTNQECFLLYLRLYETKDLWQIAEMLAPDVTLRDWKVSVKGRAAALEETRVNFESAESIEIQPLKLYERNGSVAGELRILINGSTEIFVIDTMDFDANGKIKGIRAYLGRGDE